MKHFLLVLSFALSLLCAPAALALTDPSERLADPALEARALELTRTIRCVVCQNQSIDESNAEIAKDMRVLVRQKVTEGFSDADIKTYLVDRYGDYILLTPPLRFGTVLLWLGPSVLLISILLAFKPFINIQKRWRK